jgi:putative flippase GtrA
VISQRFPRFLIAGGIAALANMGSRWVLDLLLPYVPSIVLAYLVGMATAFMLNRRFVFTASGNTLWRQVGWFTLVNIAALAQTVLVSLLLSRWLLPAVGWTWQADTIAHVVGVIVPVFTSYAGHKRLTFR